MDGGTQSEVAAIYNTSSNTFTPYHVPQLAEAAGHVLLPDGRGLIIGGVLLFMACFSDCMSVCLCSSTAANIAALLTPCAACGISMKLMFLCTRGSPANATFASEQKHPYSACK